jgi:multisubunit Na+/H+ antiporter MnhC subunit
VVESGFAATGDFIGRAEPEAIAATLVDMVTQRADSAPANAQKPSAGSALADPNAEALVITHIFLGDD